MSNKILTALFILLAIEFLAIAIIFGGDTGYGDLELPERKTLLHVPPERDCPLDYIRYGEGMCWDIYVPTSTPWTPPPGTTPYILPTLTPTPPSP